MKRRFVLLLTLLITAGVSLLGQVVVSSTPLLPPTIDKMVAVADWNDSVYIVTGSGSVVRYDTLFERAQMVAECANLHIVDAFTYLDWLCLQSNDGRLAVKGKTGRIQFIDVGYAVVGRSHTMQPFFVTQQGTFTIAGPMNDQFSVVRSTIQIPFSSRITAVSFGMDCAIATYFPQPLVTGTYEEPIRIYRNDGSMQISTLNVDDFDVPVLIALNNNSFAVFEPMRVSFLFDADSRNDHWVVPETSQGIRVYKNGSVRRSAASAPLIMLHGRWQLSQSEPLIWNGFAFDGLVERFGSYRYSQSVVSTDKAFYLWLRDGYVIRTSLESGYRSTRRSAFDARSEITTAFTVANTYPPVSTVVVFDSMAVLRSCLVKDGEFEWITASNGRIKDSLQIVGYHRFDSGHEMIVGRNEVGVRSHSGDAWLFDRDTYTSLFTEHVSLTGNRYLSRGRLYRFDTLLQQIAVQHFSERFRTIRNPVVVDGNAYFQSNSVAYRFSLADTADTIVLQNVVIAGELVGAANGRLISIRSLTTPQSLPSTYDSVIVYSTSLDGSSRESVAIGFPTPTAGVVPFVVGDTIRILVPDRSECIHIAPSLAIVVDSLRRPDFVEGIPINMINPVRIFSDSSSIVFSDRNLLRLFRVRFDVDLATVGVDVTNDVDVVLQHIFMMNVYPNPATLHATLEMRRHGSSEASATELFLVDLLGNRVRDFTAAADFRFTVGTIGRATLDYSGLPSGQYLLVMRNGGVTSSKLVSIAR